MRFGLSDGIGHTLEEVGKEFGVTRERIRQIEAKVLQKMRDHPRSASIRDDASDEDFLSQIGSFSATATFGPPCPTCGKGTLVEVPNPDGEGTVEKCDACAKVAGNAA